MWGYLKVWLCAQISLFVQGSPSCGCGVGGMLGRGLRWVAVSLLVMYLDFCGVYSVGFGPFVGICMFLALRSLHRSPRHE